MSICWLPLGAIDCISLLTLSWLSALMEGTTQVLEARGLRAKGRF